MKPRYILGEEKAKVIQERLFRGATQVQLQRRRFDGWSLGTTQVHFDVRPSWADLGGFPLNGLRVEDPCGGDAVPVSNILYAVDTMLLYARHKLV